MRAFGYDDVYRLISAQASGGGQGNYAQQSYTYDVTTGNLASKAGVTYTYGDANHAHAVTALSNGNTYSYDANGNMTQRYISGQTYTLSYDAENHMTGVSGAASAAFTYNGDGQRVISTLGNDTTVFIGNYFEWHVATDQATQYYYSETSRIGMRTSAGGLQFIMGDHLGSSSIIADPDGSLVSSQGYMPWGETRFGGVGTEYQFTGQFRQSALGLDYYNARWFDPSLAQFTQPDSVIPGLDDSNVPTDPLVWNRYSYANDNPFKYNDPSGHLAWLPVCIAGGAIVGAAVYLASTNASGGPISTSGLIASAGMGALGGALIGIGVGAAAVSVASAAIGSGAGVIGGELGYTLTAGANFDTGDMAIAALTSGVAGAITGGVGASSIAGSETATAINVLANGGASAAQYTATQLSNGKPVNPTVAAANGLIGGTVGLAFEIPSLGDSQISEYARYWMAIAKNPVTEPNFAHTASRMATRGFVFHGVVQSFRSGVENIATNFWLGRLEY